MKCSSPFLVLALLLIALSAVSVFLWLNTESLFRQMQNDGFTEQLHHDWETRSKALNRLVLPFQSLTCYLFILSSIGWLFERPDTFKKRFKTVVLVIAVAGLILLTAIPLSKGSIGLIDVLNGCLLSQCFTSLYVLLPIYMISKVIGY